MSDRRAFTGYSRNLATSRSVQVSDRIAQLAITIGGIGTIVAVATVCLFLASVVLPLFRGADQTAATGMQHDVAADDAPVTVRADEYRLLGCSVAPDGTLTTFRFDTGETLATRQLFPDRTPTAWSFSPADSLGFVGFEDGTVQAMRLDFNTDYLREVSLTEDFFRMRPGDVKPFEGSMVDMTVEGLFRRQTLEVSMLGASEGVGAGPVLALDHAGTSDDAALTVLVRDGETTRLLAIDLTEEEDMFSGETTLEYEAADELLYEGRAGVDAQWVFTAAAGRTRYAVWGDGTVHRYGRDGGNVILAEHIATEGAPVTAANMLIGDITLVLGRADGTIEGWFPAPKPEVDDGSGLTVPGGTGAIDGGDGFELILARRIGGSSEVAVRSLGMATRSRMLAAGYDDGTVATYYMVSGDRLSKGSFGDGPVEAIGISPKEDAIIVATDTRIGRFDFNRRYPEASVRTLFAPVLYEGYAEPLFMWQSSSASDDSEPKLSLIPLIFGTLKATFYSLLIGAPIALLAAIYTSEFLNPRIKAWVKPTIEMMASLPSVVLGFIAALVFAPIIERAIPAAIGSFVTIPFVLLLGAMLWQLLPQSVAIRMSHWRVGFVALVLPVGIWLAMAIGPALESLLFGGNVRLWLNGRHASGGVTGSPLGGWVLLLLPFSAIIVGLFMTRVIGPRLRSRFAGLDRRTVAMIDLGKFAAAAAATVGLAVVLGTIMTAGGFDVRAPLPTIGSFVDTYDQRNALVVGFVMGFAIIPIIYTIADDALSTVPDHLRGASLGAGATPWQTAVRIVIPTAMSGLFSALMIGLGRAVGETMIVLMAAGNTPVMNINMFEGFRTLAANLAVELPEAAIGTSHYRVLFLAALVLFAMTFILNTIAETIRLRFRKRAYQL